MGKDRASRPHSPTPRRGQDESPAHLRADGQSQSPHAAREPQHTQADETLDTDTAHDEGDGTLAVPPVEPRDPSNGSAVDAPENSDDALHTLATDTAHDQGDGTLAVPPDDAAASSPGVAARPSDKASPEPTSEPASESGDAHCEDALATLPDVPARSFFNPSFQPHDKNAAVSSDDQPTLFVPEGRQPDRSAGSRLPRQADGDATYAEGTLHEPDASPGSGKPQTPPRPIGTPDKTFNEQTLDLSADNDGAQPPDDAASTAVLNDARAPDATLPEDARLSSADQRDESDATIAIESQTPEAGGDVARGHRLDRFEIRRVLGEGAFGTVYQAYDPKLDRLVAIKVAKTGMLVGRSDVDRFLREARSAAQLRHPNIVPVYEVVQSGHTSFIAYEFVEGRNLKHVLRERGRISQREAARLVAILARALHYAHSHGIVHRDVKPENVLLDKDEVPHILDFGIARRDEGATSRTLEGALLGTPAYMSPEQASGQSYMADARSDVWSLGIMINEMLTGALPFRGTITDILVAVKQHEAKPLRQFDPTISQDLETICQKCLAKNPEERFQSAEELADELDRWLRGEPILSRPISLPARVWRWACRNPLVASLVTAIVVISLTLGTISGIAGLIASREADRARDEQRQRSFAQVTSLLTAQPESVPVLMETLEPFREDVLPRLEELQADGNLGSTERVRLRLAQLVLGTDDAPQKARYARQLLDDLLKSPAGEFLVLREFLQPYGTELTETLWQTVDQNSTEPAQRFRAACALAAFAPDDARWARIASDVTGRLLTEPPGVISQWMTALAPVRDRLLPDLQRTLESDAESNQRYVAAAVIDQMFADRAEVLMWRLERAEPTQLASLLGPLSQQRSAVLPQLREALGVEQPLPVPPDERATEVTRRSNAAVALLSLGAAETVLPLLSSSADNELRTAIIHRLGPAGVDPGLLIQTWETAEDVGRRIAVLQSLQGYGAGVIAAGPKSALIDNLLSTYREHSDPGVHSTIRWLLERWDAGDLIAEIDAQLAQPHGEVPSGQGWFVNGQKQTFAVFRAPIEFSMGSPPDEEHRQTHEILHTRRIDRDFAVGTREVTVAEFQAVLEEVRKGKPPGFEYDRTFNPTDDCPALQVNWYDAVKYCRWLSEQEGVPDDQMCYPPLDQIGPNMTLPANLLERTGYRLPTSGEWEFACRAGTTTARHYGRFANNLDPMHAQYAWCVPWSEARAHPVGLLKPNDFGLFDMYGNAMEWSQSWYFDDPTGGAGRAEEAVVDGRDERTGVYRELRGGTHDVEVDIARSAERDFDVPMNASFELGFRLARTLGPGTRAAPASPSAESRGKSPGQDAFTNFPE